MPTHQRFVALLLACLLLACPALAKEHKAKPWIDASLDYGNRFMLDANDDAFDAPYEGVELYYRLVNYQVKLGQKQQASQTLTRLYAAANLILLEEDGEDLWPRTYLPGPAMALGVNVAAKLPDDALNLAFIQENLAETHATLGNKTQYDPAVDKLLGMLDAAQQQAIKDAKEFEYKYNGTYLAWYSMKLFRDVQDLDNAKRLAAFDWIDPAEKSGALAILAQMQWAAGEKEKAKAHAQQALTMLEAAVAHERKELALANINPDDEDAFVETYTADLDSNLPELYAALYLTQGQAAAEKAAQRLTREDVLWQMPAYTHTATALRRAGQADTAAQMIKRASLLSFEEDQPPSTFDMMHLCREMAMQGKAEQAADYCKSYPSHALKAFGMLGIAEAMFNQE